jgi:hypothetical protein
MLASLEAAEERVSRELHLRRETEGKVKVGWLPFLAYLSLTPLSRPFCIDPEHQAYWSEYHPERTLALIFLLTTDCIVCVCVCVCPLHRCFGLPIKAYNRRWSLWSIFIA